jgi:7-cyano-7-deazaguanine synthase
MVASAFGAVKHLVIAFDLSEIGGSALTSDIEVPKRGSNSIPRPHPLIPVTYVPARNTIFLSFALSWAEVLEAGDIFIGANAVDYSGYPDCRPEYLEAFEKMANLATRVSIEGGIRFRIRAPLLSMRKAEIIKRGVALGLDYGLTWSCYDPRERLRDEGGKMNEIYKEGRGVVPCGRCESCIFRAKGFREAGVRDPLLER